MRSPLAPCNMPKPFHRTPKLFHRTPKLFHYMPKLFHYMPELFDYMPDLFDYMPELFHYMSQLFHRTPKLFRFSQHRSRMDSMSAVLACNGFRTGVACRGTVWGPFRRVMEQFWYRSGAQWDSFKPHFVKSTPTKTNKSSFFLYLE